MARTKAAKTQTLNVTVGFTAINATGDLVTPICVEMTRKHKIVPGKMVPHDRERIDLMCGMVILASGVTDANGRVTLTLVQPDGTASFEAVLKTASGMVRNVPINYSPTARSSAPSAPPPPPPAGPPPSTVPTTPAAAAPPGSPAGQPPCAAQAEPEKPEFDWEDAIWKVGVGIGLYVIIVGGLWMFLGEFPHFRWLALGSFAVVMFVLIKFRWEQVNHLILKRLTIFMILLGLIMIFVQTMWPGWCLKLLRERLNAKPPAAAVLTPEQQLKTSLEKYTKLWGPPQVVELNADKWITVLESPKAGDQIKYLSLKEFKIRDDKTTEKWRAAFASTHGAKYQGGDIFGPLRFNRSSENATVYTWIRRE